MTPQPTVFVAASQPIAEMPPQVEVPTEAPPSLLPPDENDNDLGTITFDVAEALKEWSAEESDEEVLPVVDPPLQELTQAVAPMLIVPAPSAATIAAQLNPQHLNPDPSAPFLWMAVLRAGNWVEPSLE